MKILLVYLDEDEKLKKCLESLKKYSPEIPVVKIKADRRKTKTCEQVYMSYFEENGVDDDYMFWHPDMQATEGWYKKLKEFSLFDITGVKLVYPDGRIQFYGGYLRKDGAGFHPHQFALDVGIDTPNSCTYITGPGMIVKKEVLKEIKWDEQFEYFIDVDFCLQARKKDYSVGVIPVKLVHSEGEDGFKKLSKEKNNERLVSSYNKFIAKWMDWLSTFK